MKILYVDKESLFADSHLRILANNDMAEVVKCIEHVMTYEAAVLKIEIAERENQPFDLIISALAYPGAPDEAGNPKKYGGVDIYLFIRERNACTDNREVALCFLTRPERYKVCEVFERAGLSLPEEIRVYPKNRPLIEVINDFRARAARKADAADRPAQKKSASEPVPPYR